MYFRVVNKALDISFYFSTAFTILFLFPDVSRPASAANTYYYFDNLFYSYIYITYTKQMLK